MPQSQELAWSGPLKLKIERSYWQAGGQPNAPASPLVIRMTMTNTGPTPASPDYAPVFLVKDSNGTKMTPRIDPTSFGVAFIAGVPDLQPGQSRSSDVVFIVPRGTYQLEVMKGERRPNVVVLVPDSLVGTWNLTPTEGG